MKGLEFALGQRRLIMTTALLLALAGVMAWFGMDRQEDPFFPYRYGFVWVEYPGADSERVERLVLKPLEEELSQVVEIKELRSTVRSGFAQVLLRMHQDISDTDPVWDRIRRAVDVAKREFPEGVSEPIVKDRESDTATVVLALRGSNNVLLLRNAAEKLKKRLFQLDDISLIQLVGDPGEQVTIEFDQSRGLQLELTGEELAEQLSGRNQVLSAGTIDVAGRNTVLRPATEFRSLAEIKQTPIFLSSGASIPLFEIATINLEPKQPANETMWIDGERVVGIAITTSNDTVNSVSFGAQLRALLADLKSEFQPLVIDEVFFQPDRVKVRLQELGFTLLMGVLVITVLLYLSMGLRLGLLVALIVPLVTFSSLALYAMGGGVLHQMSVVGMVIALGMLVDNAIVMVENIQWYLDQGKDRVQAAISAVKELARPLGAATGTTLAAFLPMLVQKGDTGDFTRAIPIMIMITIFISYIFAVFVTPVMADRFLIPRGKPSNKNSMRLGNALGQFAVEKPSVVLVLSMIIIGLSLYFSQFIEKDFFPSTDRNQVVIDFTFPEGTHINYTTERSREFSIELLKLPEVVHSYQFSGSSGPQFYYNLLSNANAPHSARIVAVTHDVEGTERVIDWARKYAKQKLFDVDLVARRLGQGPPVQAPIEVRIYAEDRTILAKATEQIVSLLRSVEGAVDVRHTMALGIPSLVYEMDDATLARNGLNRESVAKALLSRTQGILVGQYRVGRDPAPILVRSAEGENYPVEQLKAVLMLNTAGQVVPIMNVTESKLEWQAAAIYHRDLQRTASVLAETVDGYTYDSVYKLLAPQLETLNLPDSVRIDFGGSVEKSGEANSELFRALPMGAICLLFFLLVEFNSFRRVFIVLATVPLAAAGVVPGLLLSNNPFGFSAMLGVLALVGIVVNNAIVLIDVVDANLALGMMRGEAIIAAVQRRTRPILLTSVTTVAGLYPLTLSNSTLWPPMAWSIISGLIASTALTLLVVPALCKLLITRVEKA